MPELINLLDINGKVITSDAMGYQKDIDEKLVFSRGMLFIRC
ncbi:transposase [Salmonella enterica subsp. arizonae]|nr:transposase [Salmonella enterica]EJC6366157.1 transposase [Salmonella enterica subsp. arizonae]EJU8169434.1 transposase [Salmonella enterica subsp. arizonae]EKH5250069.1 transposase [Salmonella enterica subsp. arizonae]